MLDERDLQAISELIDGKLAASEERMKQYVDLIMENEVRPNFRLLAEGHKTLPETLAPKNRVDELAEEVSFLKTVVAALNKELNELKKAI